MSPQQTHGRTIGYVQVSTDEQSPALQKDAPQKAGADLQFEDTASGSARGRSGLARALAALEPGDTLTVWRLDRLSRSLRQLLETADAIRARGAHLHSLTERLDTS